VTKLRFISSIIKQGRQRVINIPSRYFDKIDEFEGKQIRIVIDDEF